MGLFAPPVRWHSIVAAHRLTMTQSDASCPDFSHLPTDALCVVFEHLFAPAQGTPALPLSDWLDLWTAVKLVCQHWHEVLVAHPPPLHLAISTLPESWLGWLTQLPVQTLFIQNGVDAQWTVQQQGQGDEQPGGRAGPPPGMPGPLPALVLVSGLEGCGLPQPFWSLAPLTRLQHLHLQAPVSRPEEPAVFDSSALQGLSQLTSLSLGSFADFQLEQLPAGLRRLRLVYDSQTRRLSVPCLPDTVSSLETLRVEKPGALGLCLDDVWGRVQRLDVRATELLLGVPVEDRRLIATFERPYREGNFVPPHIWGDEEADDNSKRAAEMAANHLLSTLPNCPTLQAMCLSGPAAASVKFMPVSPHARESLKWLWSVVRLQGLHNLYGLSGAEMEARRQLFEDRLRFLLTRTDGWCVYVEREAAASEAPAEPVE